MAAPLTAALDPKDGPDVDLRILIEDAEVRLQIITNLAFLDSQTDAWRELDSELSPTEAKRAAAALEALFDERNEVRIDGVEVDALPIDPAVDFEFDPGDPGMVPLLTNYGILAVARTRLTLRYPCASPPENVTVAWNIYPPNESLDPVNGERPPIELKARLTAGGRESIVDFTVQEPGYTWHRPKDGTTEYLEEVPELSAPTGPALPWLRIALLGGAVLGLVFGPAALRRTLFGPLAVGLGAWVAIGLSAPRVALPDEEQAASLFRPLHTNIYRAFAFTERSKVYDVLQRSAAGDVLGTLYDDVYRSLVMQEEGGAVGTVENVEYLDVDIESIGTNASDTPTIVLVARWRAEGVVYHWGHGHTQESEYLARYVLANDGAGWRITDYVPLEQRRVDAAPLPGLESRKPPTWQRPGGDGGELPEEF